MDFQVHKNKVLGKAGQASVEYILMVVVISTALIGLMGFSDTIKQKIAGKKMDLILKLGGADELSRSDFAFNGAAVQGYQGGGGEGDGADEQDGAGGRGKGGKGKGKGGAGDDGAGAYGSGKGGKGKGAGAGGEGGEGEEDGGGEEDPAEARKRLIVNNQEAGGSVAYSQSQTRKARRSAGYQESGSDYGDEEDDGTTLNRTMSDEDLKAKKAEEVAMQRLNIFKFLIILAIVFFFIVIVLKAKNARN